MTGENDALDFWLPQKERPDGEYTNGLRVSLSRSTAPLWGRLVKSAAPCTGGEARGQRCLTTELAIAQQMYTPEPLNHCASQLGIDAPDDSIISAPLARDRPFAGWLHADITANIISEKRLTSFGLVVGITGAQSGAEAVQKGFHHLINQVDPPGWRYQLGFRPAVNLSYTDRLRGALVAADGHDFADIVPSWSAQLGNARTSAYGDLTARLGYHVAHPWSPAARQRAGARDFGISALRRRARVARGVRPAPRPELLEERLDLLREPHSVGEQLPFRHCRAPALTHDRLRRHARRKGV